MVNAITVVLKLILQLLPLVKPKPTKLPEDECPTEELLSQTKDLDGPENQEDDPKQNSASQ